MLARPAWQTGSVIPSPPGTSWTFTLSGPQDSAREDVYPASNFLGGVGFAVMPEPGYMVPTDTGLFVLPQPEQLPDLASIIRRILTGQ